MIRPICHDIFLLSRKAEKATPGDAMVAQDLRDTLADHRDECVGMAANMIGVNKAIIIVNTGLFDLIMYNPEIKHRDSPYEAEEGCLSLVGTRKTTRFKNIEVEFLDSVWKKQIQRYSGFVAQIIQHEIDHLNGKII